MKKLTVLSVIVMVFLLSANVGAIGLFDNMIDTPEIDNDVGAGEGEYLLQVIELENSSIVKDSLENYLDFEYGIAENTEVYSNYILYSANDTSVDLNIKHKFFKENGLQAAVLASYDYIKNFYQEPKVTLLTEKSFDNNLILNNNFIVGYHDLGNSASVRKSLESALTYKLNEKNKFRVVVNPFTFNDFNSLEYTVKLGMESKINDNLTYAGHVSTNIYDLSTNNNVYINNTVEYNNLKDIELNATFIINTGETRNNRIILRGEKEINDFTLKGSYSKTLIEGGSNSIGLRNEYEFKDGYYGVAECDYRIDSNNIIVKTGLGFDI